MRRIAAAAARKDLADTVNRAAFAGSRVVITRHGKDVAAVVPIADLDLLRRIEDFVDDKAARRALRQGRKTGMMPLAKFKALLAP